jgi:hypothetical protein
MRFAVCCFCASFSVWNVKDGQASIHSHSTSGDKLKRAHGYACSAAWFDSKTVVTSDNAGAVSLFIQDFDA